MSANTVIGYVRVSTLTQVSQGDGLAVQREKIAGWCTFSSLPLRSENIFEDAGISGASTDDRPGFKAAMRAALGAGAGAVLVVYKLDRLGRNAIDVQETLAVLLDAGVRVVSLADGVDSASGMGAALLKLLTSILATFAELEKETIRTRLLDGRRRASAADRRYASEPAYGRRVAATEDGRVLEVDEGEARAVARIRELHATPGTSIRKIRDTLVAEGITPRRGATWSLSVIHGIATGRRAPKKAKGTTRIARARAEMLGEEPAAT